MEKLIVIKSMEMPDACADCLFVDYFKRQWYCKAINDSIGEDVVDKRDENCPLIEVTMEDPIVFKNGKKV